MFATISYVRQRFVKYNDLCFGGALPSIEIKLSRGLSFLGKLEYKRVYGPFGRLRSHEGFVMKISCARDLTEEMLDDVIIHEMIHYYIAYFRIKDSSAHGHEFRKKMADINERFGRHISISFKQVSTGSEAIGDGATARTGTLRRRKENIVCISELVGGELGVTVCASTKVSYIKRMLPRYYNLKSMRWFVSTDPYFDRFPRSRTPRIYKADKLTINDILNLL